MSATDYVNTRRQIKSTDVAVHILLFSDMICVYGKRTIFGNSLKPFQRNSCKQYFLFIFQETIIANGGDTEVDVFGNVLVDGREFDLSTSVSNSGHYKYISLISAAVALFFLSLCVAAFVTWRR